MTKLKNYFEQKFIDIDKNWVNDIKGIMLPLHCGHISFYFGTELNCLHFLFKQAGFIEANELENINSNFNEINI